MFETVAPEKFEKRSRTALYEAIPLSLVFHAMAGVAVVIANVWQISFPNHSPAQIVAFNIAATPPPPPPPPPPRSQPQQQVVVRKVELPREILAPTIIPDEIPEVAPDPVVSTVALVEEGVMGGVEGGEAGGVIGGTIGSVLIGDPKPPPIPNQIVIERDAPLPLYPLSQVYPRYPEDARVRAWEDVLVVRYIVGKDGRVREVTIISAPERDTFVKPTLRAIRSWRFRPLIKDGERQEVVHELTVFYKLTQTG